MNKTTRAIVITFGVALVLVGGLVWWGVRIGVFKAIEGLSYGDTAE